MSRCVVPCCGNYFGKKDQEKISFHSLPKKSYQIWLDSIGIIGDWEWKKQKKICSVHFEEKFFDRTGQTVRLKAGAIPTLYLNPGEPLACSSRIMESSDDSFLSQQTTSFSSSVIPFSNETSAFRSRNGFNNNPTSLQFKYAYRRLLLHSEVEGLGGNCDPLDTTTILSLSPNKRKPNNNIGYTIDIAIARKYHLDIDGNFWNEHDYVLDYSPRLTEFSQNVVNYISGFVIRMVKKKIKCETCTDALEVERGSVDDMCMKLIRRKDKGGLIWPSEDVVKICLKAECYVRKMMAVTDGKMPKEEDFIETAINCICHQFYHTAFVHLIDHYSEIEFESNHIYVLIKCISFSYLKIRLYNLAKQHSQSISGDQIRQKFTKLILFNHQ